MKSHEPILVLEDDLLDALTLHQALRDASVSNPVVVVATGYEALDYFQNNERPLPGLILLDLNLPGMSGLEFLERIKTSKRLQRIPVVVLTTSNEEIERHRAFELAAAGYFVKPMYYDVFVGMIKTVISYWLLAETAR